MRPVALLTDFGAAGFYPAVMRAVIHAAAPGAPVIDVTHGIEPQAVAQSAFVLGCVFEFFPADTVFVVVVDPGVGGARRNLAVEVDGRAVVCPDNGLVSEIATAAGARIVALDDGAVAGLRVHRAVGRTFHGRDVFAPVGAALARGETADRLGEVVDVIETLSVPPIESGDGWLRGPARYADPFGNVMTDITAARVAAAFRGAPLERVTARIDGVDAGPVRTHYDACPPGTLMAVINSWDRIEVSVNQGSARERFDAPRIEDVTVELRGGSS